MMQSIIRCRTVINEKGGKGVSILITGATGFVGKNFIRMMLAEGYESKEMILAVSKADSALVKAGFRLLLHKNYTYSSGELMELLQPEESIDTVIHLGALTPKGNGSDETADYGENIRTTKHLLTTLPAAPRRFLFGSSVSVYNTDESTADGRYGASKRACENLLKEQLLNTELWLLRFGPIYGPGEEAYQKIAGTFLKKAMAGENIYLKGDGSAVRHMVYVDDVCVAIIRILKESPNIEGSCHILDIVNETPVTIRQLADWAVKMAGSDSQIIVETENDDQTHRQEPSNMTTKYAQCIYSGEKMTSYREGMQQLYHHLKEQT